MAVIYVDERSGYLRRVRGCLASVLRPLESADSYVEVNGSFRLLGPLLLDICNTWENPEQAQELSLSRTLRLDLTLQAVAVDAGHASPWSSISESLELDSSGRQERCLFFLLIIPVSPHFHHHVSAARSSYSRRVYATSSGTAAAVVRARQRRLRVPRQRRRESRDATSPPSSTARNGDS